MRTSSSLSTIKIRWRGIVVSVVDSQIKRAAFTALGMRGAQTQLTHRLVRTEQDRQSPGGRGAPRVRVPRCCVRVRACMKHPPLHRLSILPRADGGARTRITGEREL